MDNVKSPPGKILTYNTRQPQNRHTKKSVEERIHNIAVFHHDLYKKIDGKKKVNR